MNTQLIKSNQILAPISYVQPPLLKPNQAEVNEFSRTTFGSAKFADPNELVANGLSNPGEGRTLAPCVGIVKDKNGYTYQVYGRTPSLNNELHSSNHLLTVGKTQAGKSSGQLMPTLLNYEGGCLINDPKGELCRKSSGCRTLELGHAAYRFDPELEDSNVYNPLSSIRTKLDVCFENMTLSQQASEQDDALFLAEMLITPSGDTGDVFWETLAHSILAGVLLYVATSKITEFDQDMTLDTLDTLDTDEMEEVRLKNLVCVRERSMYEVVRLLFVEPKAFSIFLKQMLKSTRPLVQNSAAIFMRLEAGEGKIAQSVFAMYVSQLSIWKSSRIRNATYKKPPAEDVSQAIKNDFEFTDLANGYTTIYINYEPDLSDTRSVLRVLIGIAMRQLKQHNKHLMNNPARHNRPPVLFLLDEFSTLGYMRPIEEALSFIAGYNVRFWFFVQDICQLKQHYPKSWTTFFSNTGTQCYYGINEIETAKFISEMLGNTTVTSHTFNRGTATGPATFYGSNSSSNHSITTADVSRPLMTADEIMLASKDHLLVFNHGIRPILGSLQRYYLNPELLRRSQLMPMHRKVYLPGQRCQRNPIKWNIVTRSKLMRSAIPVKVSSL
ncbi:type IV secretory system conjugative DNA transfer family protein [Methylomonas sp. OY6]|uniref:Type IV secretory system conjugative DNA transfer family protein n=1 Tax=Methylomonas defluvii TaxID=3045149 RepID=A0ABU4UF19_9GAMM|nr:type IV secretory system conjugative DNA transfer family protein [Methylomonas sp. OY6]MDX8128016.1 type IV secretory system conjugative DNA transfer family protein [Methylomonas sp. OY6]